jgi:hypothetical protein
MSVLRILKYPYRILIHKKPYLNLNINMDMLFL